MLVCAGASVCACICRYAIRIASRNKILHFKNTFIIIIIIFTCVIHAALTGEAVRKRLVSPCDRKDGCDLQSTVLGVSLVLTLQ